MKKQKSITKSIDLPLDHSLKVHDNYVDKKGSVWIFQSFNPKKSKVVATVKRCELFIVKGGASAIGVEQPLFLV